MTTGTLLTVEWIRRGLGSPARRATFTAVTFAVFSVTLSCARPQPPAGTETRTDAFQRSVAIQKRLNRYFHDQVRPKLAGCWQRIQGTGAIAMKFSFVKDQQGRWAFERLEGAESNLPEEQVQAGLACMRESAAATSFAFEPYDGKSESYVAHWNWPVPLPPDADQQADAMFRSAGGSGDSATGGCDGKGTPAKCYACYAQFPVMECRTVCVGYDQCSINHGGGFRWCIEGNACASGGPFGLGSGGVIMQ